jgi:hypothetical protein
MPDWLAEYRPELWSEDPSDDIERYYFGRFRWEDARQEWAAGGNPQPTPPSARPRTTPASSADPYQETPRG